MHLYIKRDSTGRVQYLNKKIIYTFNQIDSEPYA